MTPKLCQGGLPSGLQAKQFGSLESQKIILSSLVISMDKSRGRYTLLMQLTKVTKGSGSVLSTLQKRIYSRTRSHLMGYPELLSSKMATNTKTLRCETLTIKSTSLLKWESKKHRQNKWLVSVAAILKQVNT